MAAIRKGRSPNARRGAHAFACLALAFAAGGCNDAALDAADTAVMTGVKRAGNGIAATVDSVEARARAVASRAWTRGHVLAAGGQSFATRVAGAPKQLSQLKPALRVARSIEQRSVQLASAEARAIEPGPDFITELVHGRSETERVVAALAAAAAAQAAERQAAATAAEIELALPAVAAAAPEPEIVLPAVATTAPEPEIEVPAVAISAPEPEIELPAVASAGPEPEIEPPANVSQLPLPPPAAEPAMPAPLPMTLSIATPLPLMPLGISLPVASNQTSWNADRSAGAALVAELRVDTSEPEARPGFRVDRSEPVARPPLPAVSADGDAAVQLASNQPASRAAAAPRARAALPELDCVIEPDEVVDVGSPVPGVVERVLVERSDSVEAGQLLAHLESDVEAAQVALARVRADMDADVRARTARLALGERVAARNEQLFERRALSLEQKDQAETEVRVAAVELERSRAEQRIAELELARARAALARRSIASPIDGVVVERFLSAGELVQDQPLLRVARLDPLRVEVIVPAELFGDVTPGMRAEVMPEAPASGRQQATVTVVDRVIDSASSTFGVRLALSNPGHRIPGGLGCKVRFLSD